MILGVQRPAGPARRSEAVHALVLVVLVVVLTIAGCALRDMPAGLGPGWIAAGVLVGPLLRWPAWQAVPVAAAALLTGLALGGRLDLHTLAETALLLAQCSFVAARLRRAVPLMQADLRPMYRVRLAHLLRFLFAITLPAALAGGMLVALLDTVILRLSADLARTAGLMHAAATGLSIAVLAPLMWWEGMRTVPWRVAALAALAAGVGVMLPVLAAGEGRLFWLAPAVVLLAGYAGSIWTVAVCVASLSGTLLLQSRLGLLPAFDGPEGFMVWLLVTWRLLAAGLLAALWSERRGGLRRRPEVGGSVAATAAAATHRWHGHPPAAGDWLLVILSPLLPPQDVAAAQRLAPGSSLRARTALTRVAGKVRDGDLVVGLGCNQALLLLHLRESRAPRPGALQDRCRSVTHDGLTMGPARRLPTAAVQVLLTSAAWLDDDEEAVGRTPAADAVTPWPVPGPVILHGTR